MISAELGWQPSPLNEAEATVALLSAPGLARPGAAKGASPSLLEHDHVCDPLAVLTALALRLAHRPLAGAIKVATPVALPHTPGIELSRASPMTSPSG
jgi:hypothetical protein